MTLVVLTALAATPALAGKAKITTPVIACGVESSEGSIDIDVMAPSPGTGLPAGFSIQWQSAEDFGTYGWPADSSCPVLDTDSDGVPDTPTCGDSFCKVSFSGNASGSRYVLAAGQSMTVRIGDLLFDNGTSVESPTGGDCTQALQCGTDYVFRAFGHATRTLNRSDFTDTLTCSTQPCQLLANNCTLTQGFWRTHGPVPVGNNSNEWPATSLTLGTVTYTDLELLSILNTPAQGNGLIALAHQLIAAKLSIAKGADDSAIAGTIAAADAMIGSLVVPPVGSGFLKPSVTSPLVTALNDYNVGLTGPGHCDSETVTDLSAN